MNNLELFADDELQIYQGKDILLAPGITIHQPTLDEICEYGEHAFGRKLAVSSQSVHVPQNFCKFQIYLLVYWNMIYTLTSTGADLKFQLYDMGVDYTDIDDFTLFYSLLAPSFNQSKTSIITGDLDFFSPAGYKAFYRKKSYIVYI